MTLTPLITAEEGFPAMERLVASAREELLLSFRIIDPRTRLRAPELLEMGLETWADLIAWVTRKGVRLRLLIADFDPLFIRDLHRNAWVCASQFADVVQGDTQILCAPHGQRAGSVWRLFMRGRIRQAMRELQKQDPTQLTPVERLFLKAGPVLRPVTLHQKFAIADGKRCVIGGLDINERRFDTKDHDRAPDQTWHDLSVAIEDDDFAASLAGHFAEVWNAAMACGGASMAERAAQMPASARAQGRADLRVLRTFSSPCEGAARLSPQPRITEHETALIKLFQEAERFIYIETQFLRHAPLTDALVAAAARAPDLHLVVILPAAADRVLFDEDYSWDARHAHGLQMRQLDRLQQAFGPRLALLTPVQPHEAAPSDPAVDGAGPVYLHSKVTLVDDSAAIIGSANLNGRSMRWDTEASALIRNGDFAANLLDRLGQKWLRLDGADLRDARTWQTRAEAEATRAPDSREAFVLPFPMAAGHKFARKMMFLPADMF
ncbi:phospholipase D family protein [Tropicibacter naphthalenivorans]|uniref:Phospholipase D n=1 Tax=Tropicibacter naphthalenivorans TaxID=441103 RepID=A0A0P1GB09_9RHOB|nr:phospholipase D family protein [Tropicibacter naphthalenivorans]CUH78694.1 cardiolipin synthetase [Tropicibacter naphthalenivorans]SMC81250.1 Phospholipase D Active site motif-containing protein [Tropicibacter naphthalenivorans]